MYPITWGVVHRESKEIWLWFVHRICAWHLYANLSKKYKRLQYRDVFWKITKSSNEVDYNKHEKEK